MPSFVNFNNFTFMFDRFKQPLTIIEKSDRDDKRDKFGQPVNSMKSMTVNESIFTTSNPNLTYTNTEGGQQSELSTVWESLAIKDAPRNTIVKDSHGHTFKTVSSTQVSGTNLWYYQLKETGDKP